MNVEHARGAIRLIFGSVEAITSTVEAMHETVARAPMPWEAPPAQKSRAHGAIAAGVYSTIRGVNRATGEVLDRALRVLPDTSGTPTDHDAEVRSIAALNGVLGDHLEASSNPLCTAMSLRTPEGALDLTPAGLRNAVPKPGSKVVIFVHGLCLSELDWWRRGHASIGDRLEEELGWTPLYLRYNTGRHISHNGRELAEQLGRLFRSWPCPIESLTLVGHSMGGLVIRSACWYAPQSRQPWLGALTNVACLGTPHHGSMVAKAVHVADAALRRIPYAAPFAVGERLSAGMQDLRHGNLLDEDWLDEARGFVPRDLRRPVPLLPGVDYYFLVASIGRNDEDPLGRALGDLLVRAGSASGEHADKLRHLDIDSDRCRVFHEKHHFDLLDDPRVHRQLIDWFRGQAPAAGARR